MDSFKKRWAKIPSSIRKPLVFIIGLLLVIAAGLTGPLPGPGGIPLFLIGITILASEFAWAERVKNYVLKYVKIAGKWLREHIVLGTILIILALSASGTAIYLIYFK